jgi:protocatechuate 3,4-dioxygenase beta subunit
MRQKISRRDFVAVTAATSAAALLGCATTTEEPRSEAAQPPGGPAPQPSSSAQKPPSPGPPTGGNDGGATPACIETEDDPEGPYYTPGAPNRTTLVDDATQGTRLLIRGQVRSTKTTCAALGGAVLDVWQADAAGAYDNAGFGLRGKFVAASDGRFEIRTVVPGRYLDGAEYRPTHIHVKVSADGHELLTTQLYFEGDPYNAKDGMFKPALAMKLVDEGGGKAALFDFVLRPAN